MIKQCRERLRVAMDWRARLDRIWTEYATIELLQAILPEGTVPRILFDDRSNYLFAMTCAPDDSVTWKSHTDGRPALTRRSPRDWGPFWARSTPRRRDVPPCEAGWPTPVCLKSCGSTPTTERSLGAHAGLAARIDALIAAMNRPAGERTLVLGDFSPKNILVHKGGLILLDFECAHAGDPAFDLGFFLSHLLLKSIYAASQGSGRDSAYIELAPRFWSAYLVRRAVGPAAETGLVRRACLHTAACVLARVDGKSPVEYLDAKGQSDRAGLRVAQALEYGPATWDELMAILANASEGSGHDDPEGSEGSPGA